MFIKPSLAAVIMYVAIAPLNQYFPYNIVTFLLITMIGAAVYGTMLLIIKDEFACFAMTRGTWQV